MSFEMKVVVLLSICNVFISFPPFVSGRAFETLPEIVSRVDTEEKVYQNGATSGYTQSNSTAAALMSASGGPAGVVNHGGTTTSFNGSSSVNQNQPFNTSSSIGGSLSANCGGGQLGTFIAGQQGIGLHSVGNCFSYVNSKDNVETNQSDKEKS